MHKGNAFPCRKVRQTREHRCLRNFGSVWRKALFTLRDVNSGKVLGRTTFERWGVVTPTQDKLRHVALDVTAAVVAGNGSRERIVNPVHKVYTVADHKKGKAAYATMTLEHDVAFVLSSDTQTNGRYEARIENRP